MQWGRHFEDDIGSGDYCLTFGHVDTNGNVFVGEHNIGTVGKLGIIANPYANLLFSWDRGKFSFERELSEHTVTETLTVDARGKIADGVGRNHQMYPMGPGTITVEYPSDFFQVSGMDAVYIPKTAVKSVYSVDCGGQETVILHGRPDMNKVILFGGTVCRVAEFISPQTDELFVVKGGEMQEALGLAMSVGTIELTMGSNPMMVPGTDVEVCIPGAELGATYKVNIPDAVEHYVGKAKYYPFKMDGTKLFTKVGSEFVSSVEEETDEVQGVDVKLLALQLANDEALCKKLAPVLADVINMLPPTVRGKENAIVSAIDMAAALGGAQTILERKIAANKPKLSDNALPSDIL